MSNQTSNNIVICSFNSKYVHSSLGIWYIFESLRNSDFDCYIYESTIHKSAEISATEILEKEPKAVLFSCYIWNITIILEVCKIIKTFAPNIRILLGGPEAEHNAKKLLEENPFIDCISLGEGEYTAEQTLNALISDNLNKGINIAFIENGTFFKLLDTNSNNNINSCHYQSYKNLYSKEYFKQLNGRIAYIETTRGCPYRCAFCLSGSCGKLRFFPIEIALKNLDLLISSETKTIKFVDRTFNANSKHANVIWEYIRKLDTDTCFHFEIAGDILSEDSFRILEKMPVGRVQLEIGIQSINENTLSAIHRKTNTETLLKNIKKLISFNNMHIHIDLIAGLPLEDLDSFKKGFDTIFNLNSHMLQLGFLKILSGSTMHAFPDNFPCKYTPTPPYEVMSTPYISPIDIAIIKQAEDSLERLYNSQRFTKTVDFLIKRSQLTPFDFFASVPKVPHGTDIETYAQLIYNTYMHFGEEDLRDVMVTDCLEFNSTGRLFKVLHRQDSNLKKVTKYLSKQYPIKGIKRGSAILYGENKIIYVDYINKDFITKRYSAKKIANVIDICKI